MFSFRYEGNIYNQTTEWSYSYPTPLPQFPLSMEYSYRFQVAESDTEYYWNSGYLQDLAPELQNQDIEYSFNLSFAHTFDEAIDAEGFTGLDVALYKLNTGELVRQETITNEGNSVLSGILPGYTNGIANNYYLYIYSSSGFGASWLLESETQYLVDVEFSGTLTLATVPEGSSFLCVGIVAAIAGVTCLARKSFAGQK